MCELLALSTSQPAQLTFSLHTLASRGSAASTTHDGWGVAFYQGKDVALFREPLAAGDSALVRYLETQGPQTQLAISHIRHATQGAISFSNTQPFVRELGGQTHVFAHNGDLPNIQSCKALALGAYRPVGQTDSEYAFCALMERLRALWGSAEPPALDARLDLLASFASQLRALGPANFLYADGDALFAHGDRRLQPDSGHAGPPGLWTLQQHCAPADTPPGQQAGVAITQEERTSLLVASVPLNAEDWEPLGEGELVAVRHGELLARRSANTAR
ncbi:MAG: class II glutamine amidotransferase [Polaromonas sp.]|nr:class II glutamine amidotransferase [Polaromonas sp.]MDP3412471.1 class II glutamine amidotransferase [Polaromonas sp.]